MPKAKQFKSQSTALAIYQNKAQGGNYADPDRNQRTKKKNNLFTHTEYNGEVNTAV